MSTPNRKSVAIHETVSLGAEAACEGVSSARAHLLQCAAEVFAKRGYAGGSVAEIARQADISKSTVFHHFPSKRELYLAVIEAAASDFARTLDSLMDSSGPLSERLSHFQCQHMDHIMSNGQVTHLVLRELQKVDAAESKILVRDVLSGNFQRLVQFIEQAQAHGFIKSSVDASVAALTLISANVFYFQHHQVLKYLPNFKLAGQPVQYAQAVSELIFNGLNGKDSNDANQL